MLQCRVRTGGTTQQHSTWQLRANQKQSCGVSRLSVSLARSRSAEGKRFANILEYRTRFLIRPVFTQFDSRFVATQGQSQGTSNHIVRKPTGLFFRVYKIITFSMGAVLLVLIVVLLVLIRPGDTAGSLKGRADYSLQSFQDTKLIYRNTPTSELYKQLFILNLCDQQWFLTAANYLLNHLVNSNNSNNLNMFSKLIWKFIEKTVFQHFCAGATLEEVEQQLSSSGGSNGVVRELKNVNIILDRAVEHSSPEQWDSNAQHIVSAINSCLVPVSSSTNSNNTSNTPLLLQPATVVVSGSETHPTLSPAMFPALQNKVQFVSVKVSSLTDPQLLKKVTTLLNHLTTTTPQAATTTTNKAASSAANNEIDFKRITQYLSAEEANQLEALRYRLWSICAAATSQDFPLKHNNSSKQPQHHSGRAVSILIDAEESEVQGAIHWVTGELMSTFNKDRAVVYNTYQCYFDNASDLLREDLERAKQKNIHLGAKLVRGAYLNHERESVIGSELLLPNKTFTDSNYDRNLDYLLRTMTNITPQPKQQQQQQQQQGQPMSLMSSILTTQRPTAAQELPAAAATVASETLAPPRTIEAVPPYEKVSVVIATHNLMSVMTACQKIRENYILPNDNRVTFAQLKGMGEHLTATLGYMDFNVAKLYPYGPMDVVLPYLMRRVEENKDVFSGTQIERQLLWHELEKRNFGLTGRMK